jgi:CHAT domain-containing protein
MTQNNLAIAYGDRIRGERADNLEQAIECYEAALTIRTRSAFPQNHTETLSNLGNLYRSNQQWQLAYDTYTPAIETVEFLRGEIHSGDETKQKLAEEYNRVYLGMVEVCIALKRYAEAVEFAERSKGQNLIELLSVKDLYPQGEIPSEVRQELQQLRQRIAEENRRLQQAPKKNYDTINQLRQDFAAKSLYTPLKFGEIQQLVDEKTAIVEWYILVDSFCAFIITSENSRPKFLSFPESDLDSLVAWLSEYLGSYGKYRNKVSNEWQDSLQKKLANLAQILHIDEIVQAIPKPCDKLILIPHRYLHLFPLHALPTNSKYLVDAFPRGVSYAPSCQILHQVQKYQRGKFDRLFAIQNPTDDLMAADIEVETIKNIFPHPEILVKENAKKGKTGEKLNEKLAIAAQVANSHHLFFSCHGSFNLEDPLQSGLQLADDVLTLEEIFRHFNLSQCSLVTLSACETGQVQLDNTDEYISLTSGFLLAGSPSLYVTLWSVNAFSTAILLIKTYENLYHQPGKLALALNQAQIWVRDTDIQGFLDWTNQSQLLDDNWRGILQCSFEEDKATHGVNAKIYQNPYHWAGFCAAGKGEQNMANSITKLEVFQQLIQESDLFVNLRDALVSLKGDLTNNDEENIKIIEKWLQDKPTIQQKYQAKLLKSGSKGIAGTESDTQLGEKSESLIKTIEQAVQVEDINQPAPKEPPSA